MTIQELKAKNIASGGKFFARDTMKFFGDTMKNFGIEKITFNTVRVYRKNRGGKWLFNSITGQMIFRYSA